MDLHSKNDDVNSEIGAPKKNTHLWKKENKLLRS